MHVSTTDDHNDVELFFFAGCATSSDGRETCPGCWRRRETSWHFRQLLERKCNIELPKWLQAFLPCALQGRQQWKETLLSFSNDVKYLRSGVDYEHLNSTGIIGHDIKLFYGVCAWLESHGPVMYFVRSGKMLNICHLWACPEACSAHIYSSQQQLVYCHYWRMWTRYCDISKCSTASVNRWYQNATCTTWLGQTNYTDRSA